MQCYSSRPAPTTLPDTIEGFPCPHQVPATHLLSNRTWNVFTLFVCVGHLDRSAGSVRKCRAKAKEGQKKHGDVPLLWIEHSTSRNRIDDTGTRSELQSGALPGELKRLFPWQQCQKCNTNSTTIGMPTSSCNSETGQECNGKTRLRREIYTYTCPILPPISHFPLSPTNNRHRS